MKSYAGGSGARPGSGIGHFDHTPLVQIPSPPLRDRRLGDMPEKRGRHEYWRTPVGSVVRNRRSDFPSVSAAGYYRLISDIGTRHRLVRRAGGQWLLMIWMSKTARHLGP